tara:strand:- start:10281 stop:10463 length:183 start_codon:yes stop_codon:yes gene_type:complete
MTGFLNAAFIVVVLIIAALGFAIFAFLCLLAGKGNWAATWLVGALISTAMLLLTLGEVFT